MEWGCVMRYKFIILEGGDCVGKTTVRARLHEFLEGQGHEVVVTREPGGTTGAEEIRKLLLEGDSDRWDKEAELLLFYAARMDHLNKMIIPALSAGKVVITDRIDLSTWAFQAEPQKELHGLFKMLHKRVVAKLEPWAKVSTGILLDVTIDVALERMGIRKEGRDRLEGVDEKILLRRRGAYLRAADGFAPGYTIIDASKELDKVFKNVLKALEK